MLSVVGVFCTRLRVCVALLRDVFVCLRGVCRLQVPRASFLVEALGAGLSPCL